MGYRQGRHGGIPFARYGAFNTRERGLMFPATKKQLSVLFPLLCKRNKQRYERHLVNLLVSAKNLGYGDHPLLSGKPWGELVHLDVLVI
jgi:hypothetical protein